MPVEQDADGTTHVAAPQALTRWLQAERRLQFVERRWERKYNAYHKSDKYSPWDVRSVTSRVKARLLEADKELGEARAERAFWRGRLLRARSFDRLWALYQKDPFDSEKIELSQLALRRWCAITPMPHWMSMWPGVGKDIFKESARQCGLAVTWGLTHVDNFKEPEDPHESEKQGLPAGAESLHGRREGCTCHL